VLKLSELPCSGCRIHMLENANFIHLFLVGICYYVNNR